MDKVASWQATRYFSAIVSILFCFWATSATSVQAAQKNRFPVKTIKVIIPQSPGGAADAVPRGFVRYLAKILGVDILIENVPGAGGKIGLSKCWKAPPDGYTLLYHGIPQSIVNEHIFKSEFQTRGFAHVFGLSRSNMILLVHPDNWKTMDEFLRYAREKTLSGGVPAPGSTSHINGLVSVDKLGMKVNWVPYENSGDVLAGVAGKHLDFGIIGIDSAPPMVNAGKLRPLMVYSQGPDPIFPEVPYPEKLGYNMPTMGMIRGFVAPPKTPAELVKVLGDGMLKTTADQDFMAWAKKLQLSITPLDGRNYLSETEKQYALLEPYKKLFKTQ